MGQRFWQFYDTGEQVKDVIDDNFTELYTLTENKLIVQGFEENYTDLANNRPAADHIDEWWGVNNAQGSVVTFNRKPSGIYKSDGITWKYQGISLNNLLIDNNFTLADNVDNTKKLQFELSSIPTETIRSLTIPGSNGTLALLDDIIYDHNNLNNIQGGTSEEYYHVTSTEKTIIENTSGINTGDQDLQSITDEGNTTTSGASFGGDISTTGKVTAGADAVNPDDLVRLSQLNSTIGDINTILDEINGEVL